MARTSGNAAPGGFAAGQLRDGSQIMVLDWYDNTIGAGAAITLTLRTRYYNGKLFIEYQKKNKSTGAVLQDWQLASREFWNNIAVGDAPGGGKYTELADSLSFIATNAEISSAIGSGSNLVPVAPTNALMPFQADADGRIKVFTEAVDQNTILQNLAKTQQQLTSSFTGGSSTSGGTSGSGTTNNTVRNVLIITGVISVVVIIGIVIWKAVKK